MAPSLYCPVFVTQAPVQKTKSSCWMSLSKGVCLVCWQHAVSPRPHSIGFSRQQCKKECRCDDPFIYALLKSPSAPSQQAAELNQVALTEGNSLFFVEHGVCSQTAHLYFFFVMHPKLQEQCSLSS